MENNHQYSGEIKGLFYGILIGIGIGIIMTEIVILLVTYYRIY